MDLVSPTYRQESRDEGIARVAARRGREGRPPHREATTTASSSAAIASRSPNSPPARRHGPAEFAGPARAPAPRSCPRPANRRVRRGNGLVVPKRPRRIRPPGVARIGGLVVFVNGSDHHERVNFRIVERR
jgi:hypothetical protein